MQAIQKVSAVQQVENRIKTYIMGDDVNIGDKLPTEMQLCAELNVGRGTVREAMRLLQAKGFLELKPGRGAFIAQKKEPEREDIANWFQENEIEIKDLIDVRTAIEPLAVKLAIQKCTDKDIRKLRSIHEQSQLAAANHDASKLALCDEQFHSYIFDCSRNKILIDINKIIIRNLAGFRSKTFNIPGNVQNFFPAHAAIIEAFEKRDIELGQKSMLAHLDVVAVDLESSKYFESLV